MRIFEGRRSLEELTAYVDGGFEAHPRLGLWASPYGPVGRAKGLLIYSGTSVLRAYEYLIDEKGFSKLAAGAAVFVPCFVAVLALVLGLATLGGGDDAHPHAA